ncbi:succinate dehydrogenase/fumarate reductase iron-sulfur subunit [bacterium]|nr:succinate dehydrogenase/fumarate reductase iron-sulfur subunit [bacterium]
MRIHLKVWRQKDKSSEGRLVDYTLDTVSPDMSFLEMIDVLNGQLVGRGEEPIAFAHDCREGICGSCAMVIDGEPHGPQTGTTTCQLHMRTFNDGDTIVVEPFRAKAFPVIKDLVTDRSALDRIQAAGGYVSVSTGNAPDGNAIPIAKDLADAAMDAAACIQCGACVAACRNGSAMLFVSAKVSQFALLPQGQAERERRVSRMVWQMDEEDFGSCTNMGSCAAACPKEIKVDNIARMNREFGRAMLFGQQREQRSED